MLKGKKKLSFSEREGSSSGSVLAESTATNVFPSVPGSWTAREERALVEFILMTSRGDCWPTSVKEKFWEAAAKFVSQ